MKPNLIAATVLLMITLSARDETLATHAEALLPASPVDAKPVPADYDGDGFTDISLKGSNGILSLDFSGNGFGGRWDYAYPGYGGSTAGAIGSTSPQDAPSDLPALTWRNLVDRVAERKPQTDRFCPENPKHRVVEIREADPGINKQHHDLMRRQLIDAVSVPNTTVLLGPRVVLDFTDATDEELPLIFGPCVTLMSVSAFRPDTITPNASGSGSAKPQTWTPQTDSTAQSNLDHVIGDSVMGQSARTPSSLGPLLRFGPHRSDKEKVFFEINCNPDQQPNDNVRISGFRLYGPSFGQQSTDEIGIYVVRCLNIEISNMEIAGWGGQGIHVLDDPEPGPGQEQPNNRPGERIGRPEQVRIFGNFIHHNQHPRTTWNSHTAGYGVHVNHGAWARITENVFDFNRHAIAAEHDSGGYEARRNLVLKGGGLHYRVPVLGITVNTHQFDIHGRGGSGKGGYASVQDWYSHNAFQYLAGNAIKIRGRPRLEINIHDNIFAHEGLEDDWGDDALHVHDRDDLDVIKIGSGNSIDFDPYGRYGVCDFDGDRIDDLFLATGRTWWYSSAGKFQWSYLNARNERLNQVRLGYFDDDLRCDVLTESGGEWVISSAGIGEWKSIGAFGVPLSQVTFGRFDPNIRDHRPGATRRTTHAFRRAPNGEWLVTTLSAPDWQHAQSSSIPLSKLRFGDFTGDGVTDVLAVVGGRWAISASARDSWRRLNSDLSYDVRPLFFADLNNNNIDDIIRLERRSSTFKQTFTWWVSDDGRSRWRKLKTYTYLNFGPPAFGFAGRFGAAPGGGVLLTDHIRIGHFFSEAEIATGADPDWTSLFSF